VERRLAGAGFVARDQSIASAPVVNPSIDGVRLRPGRANLTVTGRRILVEIPEAFPEIQAADAALAREWRLTTQEIFLTYFARGYRAVDFFSSPQSGRGHYLLALPSTA
jgi:predicted GNAT superfamily acetyltransferase